jgi:sugar O-acyltransferase (sialic acid O-acetyltransferase NeuD family)
MAAMKFIIVGAGQTGQMVGEFMQRQPHLQCAGYLDDDPKLRERVFHGYRVLGGTELLESLRGNEEMAALPVMGGIEARLRFFRKIRSLGYVIPSIVDPSVNRCTDLDLGEGAVISLGANILTSVRIGPYAMIGTGVTIGHNIEIGANCIIGGNTVIGASTVIGDNFQAGTGVAVAAGPKRIGNNVFLCAGSVVFKDVPDNAVVLGNPGRVIRYQKPVTETM